MLAARAVDKCRAVLLGWQGEYHSNCPLDQRFFSFTGVNHEAMLAEIKSGKTDVQILEWVNTTAKRATHEVIAWSAWLAISTARFTRGTSSSSIKPT